MSPFGAERYQQLLKGLEAVEIRLSELAEDLRIDSQYFKHVYLNEDARRSAYPSTTIGKEAYVTDGPHGYHEVDEASPIAMLTAKSARGWFAIRGAADRISATTHRANLRSSLKADDLILSTRGTVGLCAIIEGDVLPANIDQDVARIAVGADSELDPRYLLAYLNSRFGQDWISRNAAGMVQQGLSLAKVRTIPVPRLSQPFQRDIADVVRRASASRAEASRWQCAAEESFLEELGLAGWVPPRPLTYVRSSIDVGEALRLDAEYFSPRVQQLIAKLSVKGTKVADVAPVRRAKFTGVPGECFDYIEISDVTPHGEALSRQVDGGEAPSRATWHVRSGDVITSTVRPIRRLTALISHEQDNFVCSSGFAVLAPKDVAPEVLLAYMRLPIVCELMDLHTTASMYPAIAVQDILDLPFIKPSEMAGRVITRHVQSATEARRRTADYMDLAKHIVEIALEQSEREAVSWLRTCLEDGSS